MRPTCEFSRSLPRPICGIRAGKHVYVQKPLAHSIHEARVLAEAAREHKVVTQMGNQGHSGEGARLIREWIQAGAIGNDAIDPFGFSVERAAGLDQ